MTGWQKALPGCLTSCLYESLSFSAFRSCATGQAGFIEPRLLSLAGGFNHDGAYDKAAWRCASVTNSTFQGSGCIDIHCWKRIHSSDDIPDDYKGAFSMTNACFHPEQSRCWFFSTKINVAPEFLSIRWMPRRDVTLYPKKLYQQEMKNRANHKTEVWLKHNIFNYQRQVNLSVQKHDNVNAFLLRRFCAVEVCWNWR